MTPFPSYWQKVIKQGEKFHRWSFIPRVKNSSGERVAISNYVPLIIWRKSINSIVNDIEWREGEGLTKVDTETTVEADIAEDMASRGYIAEVKITFGGHDFKMKEAVIMVEKSITNE